MIAAADLTDAYQALRGGVDMNHPLDSTFTAERYDLAVCCGVFTVGHVADDALQQLISSVHPGGAIIVSTRNSYLHDSGFAPYVEHMVGTGQVRLHEQVVDAPYLDEEGASYWIVDVLR